MPRLANVFQSRAQTRLVEFLLQNRGKIFTQRALSRFLGVSPTTIARLLEPLSRNGLVLYDVMQDKKTKVICLKEQDRRARLLIEFYEAFSKL